MGYLQVDNTLSINNPCGAVGRALLLGEHDFKKNRPDFEGL
jgi:hypothetical protein